MNKNKIKLPISLEIFLLSVVPLAIVALISALLFYSTTTKNIEETATKLALTATEKLNEEIGKTMAPFQEKVQVMNALATYNHDAQFLGTVVKALGSNMYPGFSIYYASEISRFQEGGIFEESNGWVPDPDWDPRTRPWYQNARSNLDQICFTDPYLDSRTGEVCVTISHSVTDSNEQLVGVTGSDLSLMNIATLVSNYKISDTGIMNLVDKNGMYITNRDESKIMAVNFFDDHEFLQGKKSMFLSGESHAITDNGKFFAIASVKGTPWFVVAEGNVSDFTGNVLDTIGFMLLIIAVQVVVVLIVALAFSRIISKTFASMVNHCNNFSKGDFTAHFDEYFIKEADSLARGFEAFSQNIRMLVGKIFKSASSVSEMATSLNQAADSIKAAVNDSVAAITQMSATSSNQTAAVQQVDDAMNQIVGEAQNLSKEIDSQNQIISYSSASIEEIVQSMNSVHTRINDTAANVEELVKLASENKNAVSMATTNIINVRQESASLQEMNNVISSVAAQTNLLAMNAAIEAAHAGAAGKGFAVVADEIRKLAETAAKQASSSSSYLKAIQDKIDGIANTAVSIDKSFEGTIQRINDISQVVSQLEQATGEQEMLSEQVLQALRDIQTSTHNITTNVEGITSSTGQTSQLCHRLRGLNDDVNSGITACKNASTEMQNASVMVSVVATSTKNSVADLLEAVSSFKVDRRSGNRDRRKQDGSIPGGEDRRNRPDRRQNSISLTPPTMTQ